MNLRTCCFSTAIAALSVTTLQGAVLYSTPGVAHTEDFDTLPSTPTNAPLGDSPIGWIDDTGAPGTNQFSILGWYLYHPIMQTEGGANGHQKVRISTGSGTASAFHVYRTTANTGDKALGILNSSALTTNEVYLGVRITNDTGIPLTKFTVSYTGEQYRDGGAAVPNAQSLAFQYKVAAVSLQDTGYTSVTALNFTSPTFSNTGSGATLSTPSTQSIGPVTVSGVNWLPGQDIWLRWVDIDDAGNDHGLAIDDFSFSAVPEPASIALAAMAGLGIVALRRRK